MRRLGNSRCGQLKKWLNRVNMSHVWLVRANQTPSTSTCSCHERKTHGTFQMIRYARLVEFWELRVYRGGNIHVFIIPSSYQSSSKTTSYDLLRQNQRPPNHSSNAHPQSHRMNLPRSGNHKTHPHSLPHMISIPVSINGGTVSADVVIRTLVEFRSNTLAA